MNTVVTSKEEILKASREFIRTQGWSALNIRSLATACGVSVGSIYNYFDSKAKLVESTVESVWFEIFHRPENKDAFVDIQSCIAWIYGRMEYGHKQYPGFFTFHSLGFMQEGASEGKRLMQRTWRHITEELCAVLKRDANVRPNAFTEQFTAEKLADVLFSLMLSALVRQDYDPSPVLEIIRRTIY